MALTLRQDFILGATKFMHWYRETETFQSKESRKNLNLLINNACVCKMKMTKMIM